MSGECELLDCPQIVRDGRLDGKVAIISGAGSAGRDPGIGAAISLLFGAKGCRVAVVDRDADRLAHTVTSVQAVADGEAIGFEADVVDAKAVGEAVEAVVDRWGAVDVLVNNLGLFVRHGASSFDIWQKSLDVNLTSAYVLTEAVLPLMRREGAGSIVNISSVASVLAGAQTAYSVAKAGLNALTRSLAFEGGPEGVRVNGLVVGHVATPSIANLGRNDEENRLARRRRAQASMLKAEGNAWDVAYAALFLASPESRYVSGASIPVDGGASAALPMFMYQSIAGT